MSDARADVAAAIERHKEALLQGRHVLSGLRMRDVEVEGADLAIELEIDDTVTNPTGALQGGLIRPGGVVHDKNSLEFHGILPPQTTASSPDYRH